MSVFLIVGILLLNSALSVILAQTASAGSAPASLIVNAGLVDGTTNLAGINKYMYRYALAECLAFANSTGGHGVVSPSNITSGNWFDTNWKVFVGWFINPQDGKKNCGETDFIKSAITTLGWDASNLKKAACDLGFVDEATGSAAACISSQGNLKNVGSKGSALSNADTFYKLIDAANNNGNLDISKLTPAQQYLFYARSMEVGCSLSTVSYLSDADSGQKDLMSGNGSNTSWTIILVNSASQASPQEAIVTTGSSGKNRTTSLALYAGNPHGKIGIMDDLGANRDVLEGIHESCTDLAGETFKNGRADAYLAYIANPKNAPQNNTPGTPGATGSGSGNPTSAPTCTIPGVGWIICPVVTLLGNIADSAMGILTSMFEVPASTIFKTNGDTYNAWSQIRNYGNIIFVIAFLFIIFSQVTSIGISNYGIKKLLPKLVMVAVLVNLSFVVCALAVDISNMLGYNLTALLEKAVTIPSAGKSDGTIFGGFVASVLVLSAGVIAVYFALGALIGVLLSVVLVGVTMVLLLGVRQGIVILLIVMSPLAFAAMLLPNTEGLYKKWFSLFKSMLLIFPIASLLYGAGKLASVILSTSDNWTVKVVGAALPVLMLIAVYKVFTSAMQGIEGLGGAINGMRGLGKQVNNGLTSGLRKRDQENRQILGNGLMNKTGVGRFMQRGQAQRSAHLATQKAQLGAYQAEYGATNDKIQARVNLQKANDAAATNATRKQNEDYAKALQTDPTLLKVAGGSVDPVRGVNRASQTAQAELDKAWNEDVTNARLAFAQSPTDTEALTVATTGLNGSGQAVTASERQAAVMHLMEKGSTVDKQKVLASAGTMEDQRTKNTLADMYAKSNLANLYGTSLAGALKTATPANGINLDQALVENLGKVTPETVASNVKYAEALKSAYSHIKASGSPAQVKQAEGQLNTIVDTMRKTETISSNVADDGRNFIDSLTTDMGSKYTGTKGWV